MWVDSRRIKRQAQQRSSILTAAAREGGQETFYPYLFLFPLCDKALRGSALLRGYIEQPALLLQQAREKVCG